MLAKHIDNVVVSTVKENGRRITALQFITNSEQETKVLGAALARQLRKGDLILLYGEMGAGKSAFTRGIAQGIGISDSITSPTFTILQVYTGGMLPLYHFDWYRIADASELYEMGMDEYLQGEGIAIVEWPQQAPEVIPDNHLHIDLEQGENENQRVISFVSVGSFRTLSL